MVIADDSVLIVDAIVAALADHPDLRVVATASDGPSALAAVGEHRPDVVLLDLRLGGAWGLDLLPEVRAGEEPPAVVVFSAGSDAVTLEAVREADVVAHVTKGVPLDELAAALLDAASPSGASRQS